MRQDIGNLDDIPYDLQNTIANVYYDYFSIDKGLQTNSTLIDLLEGENIFDESELFSHKFRRLQFKLKSIKTLISALRKTDAVRQPNMYNLWLSLSYDILKYDISNAMKKSGIRRRIERFFKKKNVVEIDGLIDLILR